MATIINVNILTQVIVILRVNQRLYMQLTSVLRPELGQRGVIQGAAELIRRFEIGAKCICR
jgi:hypothetical protein